MHKQVQRMRVVNNRLTEGVGEGTFPQCLSRWLHTPRTPHLHGLRPAASPLQYSRLGNSVDRGAWWATVHGILRVGHKLVTKLPPLPGPVDTHNKALQLDSNFLC